MWDRIRYLATLVPRYLRDMGYVRGLKRLDARGRRCQSVWEPHLARSRSLMLEAADRCARNGKVLVLGSSPLFDVPIGELSRRFREVVLADLWHLPRIRSAVRRYPNVRLECLDVTGVVKEAHALARIKRALEGTERKPEFFLEDGFDLIISANILSQLPLAPVRYASRRRNRAEPWRVREWMWELGPKPEIDPHRDVRHRVVGYAEFPKQVWLEREGVKER